MNTHRWLVAALALSTACIKSTHGEGSGAPPPPWGEARVLEDKPGNGRPAIPGDRVTVELTGTYTNADRWGHGPFTFIYGAGSYPGALNPVQVGSVIKLQYIVDPNAPGSRLVPFPGDDYHNEAFQTRRDRGQIIIEHKVLKVCRPMKVFFLRTGFGDIETSLGCWSLPRSAPSRKSEFERRVDAINSGDEMPAPNGRVVELPINNRPRADTTRYLADSGLHLAAREGRTEIVSWLIARGRSATARDKHGFTPLHYVGYAQRPLERFTPALEQNFLDIVDTLLAHGASINEAVQRGVPMNPTLSPGADEGQTALSYAAPECADRLTARLLERGANPNAFGPENDPPITGAARNGCPEIVKMLIVRGADADANPHNTGTPLGRLLSVSAFHEGHLESARLLVQAGVKTATQKKHIQDRLDDPGPGSFGFSNRPVAREILKLLR